MTFYDIPRNDSYSHVVQLLDARTMYLRQNQFTKALIGDSYFIKRFNDNSFESLKAHRGCVNSVTWNKSGDLILSGSDDCKINLWSPFASSGGEAREYFKDLKDHRKPFRRTLQNERDNLLIHSIPSGHEANIFSAMFMANTGDRHVVSCDADGIVRFTDLNKYETNSPTQDWNPIPAFRCHSELTYEVVPDPIDSNVFFDCSDDGTINQYDLRIRTSCNCHNCDRHTLLDLNQKHRPRRNLQSNTSPTSSGRHDDVGAQSEPESQQQFERRRRTFRLRSANAMSVTGITIRPDNTVYMAAACSTGEIRIYDRRFIPTKDYHRDVQVYTFNPGHMKSEASRRIEPVEHRITSLKYDPCGGGELLASYSCEKVYLIRPGAGKISKSGKSRKGGVRVIRKDKMDKMLDDKEPELMQNMDGLEKSLESDVEMDINMGDDEKVDEGTSDKKEEPTTSTTDVSLNNDEKDTIPTFSAANSDAFKDVSSRHNLVASQNESQPESNSVFFGETSDNDDMYSSDDEEVDENLDEFDIYQGNDDDIVRAFSGHANEKTMIKEANFFGGNSEYIMSGSDDRRIFIWDRSTGRIVNLLIGDSKVVNCIRPHPYFPIICSSGIDNDVKLWYPNAEKENVISNLEEIIERNEKSNRDHVPANIILQMLTMLHDEGIFQFDY